MWHHIHWQNDDFLCWCLCKRVRKQVCRACPFHSIRALLVAARKCTQTSWAHTTTNSALDKKKRLFEWVIRFGVFLWCTVQGSRFKSEMCAAWPYHCAQTDAFCIAPTASNIQTRKSCTGKLINFHLSNINWREMTYTHQRVVCIVINESPMCGCDTRMRRASVLLTAEARSEYIERNNIIAIWLTMRYCRTSLFFMVVMSSSNVNDSGCEQVSGRPY